MNGAQVARHGVQNGARAQHQQLQWPHQPLSEHGGLSPWRWRGNEPHVKRPKREKCRAGPNCDYDDGTGDDDGDAFVFFDNHIEDRSTGRVTRDLSDATTASLKARSRASPRRSD